VCPVILLLVLLGFLLSFAAIADILRSPEDGVRGLSTSAWLLVVILVPFLGVLAWVVAGKPIEHDSQSQAVLPPRSQRHRVVGPDDDPAFIAALNDQLRREDGDQ
jgi:hypothetical protein